MKNIYDGLSSFVDVPVARDHRKNEGSNELPAVDIPEGIVAQSVQTSLWTFSCSRSSFASTTKNYFYIFEFCSREIFFESGRRFNKYWTTFEFILMDDVLIKGSESHGSLEAVAWVLAPKKEAIKSSVAR